MNRCKFCGEVLEGQINYCPNCGKNVNKTPSKRFLKKQEKAKNFKVNYDACLYRRSYKVFSILFLIIGIISTVFYLDKFLELALEKVEWAANYRDAINNVFNIYDRVNEWVPFDTVEKLSFVFLVPAVCLLLSIISLFTKKFSWGALFYKLSAIFGSVFFIVMLLVEGIVPFAVSEDIVKLIVENEKIITIVGASLAGAFFVLGILFSFHFTNPYRPTFYQAHKAVYWLIFAIIGLVSVLELDLSINLEAYRTYTYTMMPMYIFVSSILLFIGAKYRGKIEKLK